MSSLATDPNDHHLLLDTLVAGGFAGLITETLMFPFDAMKFARHLGFQINYNTLRKGLVPTIIGSAPTSASFLFTYNAIKHYCKPLVEEKNFNRVHLFAAASAEIVTTTVRMPFDNVKKRQQILSNYVPSKQIVLRMTRKAGPSAFFTGYNDLLMSRLHSSVFTFPVWEILMARVKLYMNKTELFPHETAACGAMAGGFVGMLTNPLDVARSHLVREEIKTVEYARVKYYAEQRMQSEAQTEALRLKAKQDEEKANKLLQSKSLITVAKPVRVTRKYVKRKPAEPTVQGRFVISADHTSKVTIGSASTLINRDSDKYATIKVNLAAQVNSRTVVAPIAEQALKVTASSIVDSDKNVPSKNNLEAQVNPKEVVAPVTGANVAEQSSKVTEGTASTLVDRDKNANGKNNSTAEVNPKGVVAPLKDVKSKVKDLKVKLKEIQPEKMMFVDHLPVIYQTVKQIYKTKGIKGLTAGVVMRTCRITMGGWLFFYSYASAMNFLDGRDEIEKVEQWMVDTEEMLLDTIQQVIHSEEDLLSRQTKERLQKNKEAQDKKE